MYKQIISQHKEHGNTVCTAARGIGYSDVVHAAIRGKAMRCMQSQGAE